MKFNKKWSGIIAFCLGAVILTTSAIADNSTRSGYNQLKKALKNTTAFVSKEIDSYTAEFSVALKWEDVVIFSESEIVKSNFVSGRRENVSKSYNIESNETTEYYYYNDKNMYITKSNGETHVVQNNFPYELSRDRDPFEDEYTKDIENLADAFLGSLTDTVHSEVTDGKTLFVCDVETAQIPAYLNALCSFAAKHMILDYYQPTDRFSVIEKDAYVKEASAKAVANEDGLLTDVVAQGIVMGKDKNGIENRYSMEITYKLSDINSTSVKMPEIPEDARISKIDNAPVRDFGFSKASVGTYKRDIVDTEGEMPEKIGEREIVITEVGEASITGYYSETYSDSPEKNVYTEFEAKADRYEGIGMSMCFEFEQNGMKRTVGISGDYEGTECRIDVYDSIGKYTSSAQYFELIRVFD